MVRRTGESSAPERRLASAEEGADEGGEKGEARGEVSDEAPVERRLVALGERPRATAADEDILGGEAGERKKKCEGNKLMKKVKK